MDRQTDSGQSKRLEPLSTPLPPPWSRHHHWITPSACSWGLGINSCPVHFFPTHFPLYVQKDVSSTYLINSLSCFKFSNSLPVPRRGESVFHKVPLGPSLSLFSGLVLGHPGQCLLQAPCCSFFLAWMPVPSPYLCSSCGSQVRQLLLEACLTCSPE